MACEPIRSSWGGTWTEEKLDALEKYVNAYLTIMNVQRRKFGWKLIYFDGFAGSGSRNEDGSHTISDLMLDPFGMQVDWASIQQLKGTRTDLWILIPTGVIVNRLLDRKCELTHIDKLTHSLERTKNS